MIDTTDIPRIFLYTKPADLRKGFAGLYALARTHLSDPIHGDLYLFLNRRRTLLKALRWDGTGLCILSKVRPLHPLKGTCSPWPPGDPAPSSRWRRYRPLRGLDCP